MSEAAVQTQTAVQLEGIVKEYRREEFSVLALNKVDLEIPRSAFLALMGPSGSGKSTMLHLVAGIDKPTEGRLTVLGDDITGMSEKELAAWRSQNIGFVFQSFNLIPVLTALENVELPLLLTRLSKRERLENAKTALDVVGLSDRLDHYPRQLSGGQEQRVAIARAIVTDPAIILADEPTGDLDAASAKDVLTVLSRLNEQHGKTIIIVTHDPHAAKYADKTRYLEKGDLLPEGKLPEDWFTTTAPA
jgi:putative ABC transport system ATP-binding protein